MIICICGKSGSGKTTLTKMIQEKLKDVIYLDVDKIAHATLEIPNVIEKIRLYFGENVIINNQVDRKKLGKIVFQQKEKMQYLRDITQPLMEDAIDKIIEQNKGKIIILDYLLLPETKYFNRNSFRIYLDIPKDIRERRIMERDLIKEEDFNMRDRASIDYDLASFDVVIRDDNDIKNVLENLLKIKK